MAYTTTELIPMSQEKEELLAIACRQWADYMLEGTKARRRYWKKHKNATTKGWTFRCRWYRQAILKRHQKHRKILKEFAFNAINRGMFGTYTYSPRNSFFISESLLKVRSDSTGRDILWLRLFPLTELGFRCPSTWVNLAQSGGRQHTLKQDIDGAVAPFYGARLFKRGGKWFIEVPDTHL